MNRKRILAPLLIAMAAAWPCWAATQQAFPTPEKAVESLVAALGTEKADEARLAQLFGADWRTYIPREGVQRSDVDAFLQQYHKQHQIENQGDAKAVLAVGDEHWTLPIPLAKAADGWHFDMKAGSAEIRARRIGRNELGALQSVLAYHDAQMDYASQDRNGNGALEYAQQIFSTPGKHDGLFWEDEDDGQISRWARCSVRMWWVTTGTATTSESSMAKAPRPRAVPTAT